MTKRGEYLKELVDETTGRVSVRKLAMMLSKRAEMPDDPEKIRRTLQRHIADGEDGRDVSDRYVKAISEVLSLKLTDWPPSTPRLTLAALQRRIAELERRVDEMRDPPAPAQGGES